MSISKNNISDTDIIDMFWRREERAIDETDIKYGKLVFKIAHNILHDRLDSEECRNDTYINVWNAIPPNRPNVFPAFIVQITRRIAINRYKLMSRKKRIPSELTVSIEDYEGTIHSCDTADGEYDAREIGRMVNEYVRSLTERERYIFVARFYMSEPAKEIADALDIDASTVYRALNRMKIDLKIYLERNEVYL